MRRTFLKTDEDRLDYTVDLTDWLEGDTIDSVVCTSDSAELVLDGPVEIDAQSKKFTQWIAGGVAGEIHNVQCIVTTVFGRIKEVTLVMQITTT